MGWEEKGRNSDRKWEKKGSTDEIKRTWEGMNFDSSVVTVSSTRCHYVWRLLGYNDLKYRGGVTFEKGPTRENVLSISSDGSSFL